MDAGEWLSGCRGVVKLIRGRCFELGNVGS